MIFVDHYNILNIHFKATKKEIKKAYHKLCLEWHPDKNKNPNATEQFKIIKNSYEILYNQESRDKYNKEYLKYNKNNTNNFNFNKFFQKIKSINKINIKQFMLNIKNNIKKKDLLIYLNKINNLDILQNNLIKSSKTTYNITISIQDYYNYYEKEFKIPILTRCYLCNKKYNSLCKICKGTIYYISFKIFNLNIHKNSYNIKDNGNHMIGYNFPGDLTINLNYIQDQYYKKINNNIICIQYFYNNENIYFNYLDNNNYLINIKEYVNNNKILISITNFGIKINKIDRGNYNILLIKDKFKKNNKIFKNAIKITNFNIKILL